MSEELALGFATKSPSHHLISPLFPDKIGGRPAWLSLGHLPSPAQLRCPQCSQPMAFLLQVYSTVDDRVDCFHRVLFLFMCRDGKCHHIPDGFPPFRVFRSQLGRQNPYYSYEPPETEHPSESLVKSWIEENRLPCAERFTNICPICGCKADQMCSRCRAVYYCSKLHQVMDWKHRHKSRCSNSAGSCTKGPNFDWNDALLPEFRLSSETVAGGSAVVSSDEGEDDFESEKAENVPDDELEALAKKETEEEALFRKFREALQSEPDQVIRLQRGGNPIWLSKTPPHVPPCEVCGAERIFEFQVTPQLLSHLKLDRIDQVSPDFGSLYIFTCAASCPLPRTVQPTSTDKDAAPLIVEYQQEVVIRQMVP